MTSKKIHSSIHTLSISSYNKIAKTKQYEELIITGEYTKEECFQAWLKIYDELIAEFGLSDKYIDYIRLKKRWIKELYKVYIKGQRYRISFANVYLKEAEQLISVKAEYDFSKTLAYLTKELKFHIPLHETTVYQFYMYLKSLEHKTDG